MTPELELELELAFWPGGWGSLGASSSTGESRVARERRPSCSSREAFVSLRVVEWEEESRGVARRRRTRAGSMVATGHAGLGG